MSSLMPFGSPMEYGLGVHPASWSRSPVSCLESPAGLCRLQGRTLETVGYFAGGEPGAVAAFGLPLGEGRFGLGGGAGWSGEGDLVLARLSGAYVLTGDPVGFMEGLFGPSITLGLSGGVLLDTGADSVSEDLDCGFQFSLFPSFALGMEYTGITDERVLRTGFSHVFNRNLTVHVNYGDRTWQGGAELSVSPSVKLFAGTDGDALNGGFAWTGSSWTFEYGTEMTPDSMMHSLGVTRRFM